MVGGLLAYLWRHWGDLSAGINLSAEQLAILSILVAATWILNSLPMLIFARLMNKSLGFWENLTVLLASGLVNYLPMRLGTVIRMRFFKVRHAIDYSTFIGIAVVRSMLLLTLSGVFGCLALAGLSMTGMHVPVILVIALATAATFPLIFVFMAHKNLHCQQKNLKSIFKKLSYGYLALRGNSKHFWALVLITTIQFAVVSARLSIAFQAFGIGVSTWALFLLGPTATLLTFISITPGNLGLREWVIGSISGIAELGFKDGVFAGTLDRTVAMALSFLVGPICLYYTLRSTRRPNGSELGRREGPFIPIRKHDK